MDDDNSVVKTFGPDGEVDNHWEKLNTTQQVDTSDEFSGEFYIPQYDPDTLGLFMEKSATHASCVEVKARAVAGHGFTLVPNTENPTGKDAVEEFWRGSDSTWQLGPDSQPATPSDVLQHSWEDYESIGWSAIEVLVNENTGKPTGLAHIPANTIRVREDDIGFVQIDDTISPEKFFAPAGARYGENKKFVDSDNGKVSNSTRGVGEVANELIVLRNYSPTQPHYGTPDVISALQSLYTQLAIDKHNATFFENDATPRFAVMVTGGELTDRAWQDIKQTFENLKNSDNSHRSIILEAESIAESSGATIDIEPITIDMSEDGDFLQLMQENEHRILQAHGVPPVVAQRVENVNYSSAKSQRVSFAQSTVKPKQERFAARLNTILHKQALGVDDWEVEFNLVGGENELRQSEIANNRINEAMTVNEVRAEVGKPELDSDKGEMLYGDFLSGGNPGNSGGQ